MSLILAIEPDQRQAAQLANLVRGRLHADLVHASTTEGALTALAGIGDRVPDLVLVPSLLSAQEDAAIAGALRVIAAAANIRMLTIPMLADPEQPSEHRGVFAKLRVRKVKTTPGGCDPAVFADQIAAYLAEAAAERRAQKANDDLVAEDLAAAAPAFEPMPAPVTPVREPVPDPLPALDPVLEPEFEPALEPALERVFERVFEHELAPVAGVVLAPVVEVVAEPALETIETAPLVEDTPQPVADESRPWLIAAPAVPTLHPALEPEVIVSLDALAEVSVVHEAIAETPFLVAVEETPAAVIDEPLVAVASIEEAPVVLALDVTPVVTMAEAPVEAAVEEPVAADAPAPQTVSVSAPDPAPVVNRRRRKSTRPARPAFDDTFDLDALLAPLLSEIAATRVAPVAVESPVAFQEPASQAEAVPAMEPTVIASPPEMVAISTPALEVAAPVAAESIAPPPPVAPVVAVAAGLEPDLDPMFFAEDALDPANPAPNDRSAWLELIESLRHDIQRLKTERTPRLGLSTPNMTTPPAGAVTPAAPPATPLSKIRLLTPRVRTAKPVEDQWGLFDPEQCGFAALRAKLDEISARDEVSA